MPHCESRAGRRAPERFRNNGAPAIEPKRAPHIACTDASPYCAAAKKPCSSVQSATLRAPYPARMRPASKLPPRMAVFGEIRSQARHLSPSESANHGALPRLTVSPKTARRFLPFSPRKPPCPSRQSVCAASVLNAASFEASNAQPSSAKSARRRAALALRNRPITARPHG